MYSDDIILRTETFAPLTTKGSELTAKELDLNLVYIYRDLVAKALAGGVPAYDNVKVYEQTEAATYNGRTWLFINATPEAGVTPGSDITKWVELDPAELIHRRNSDEKLAEFTADEVTAAEIKANLSGSGSIKKFSFDVPKSEWVDLVADPLGYVRLTATAGYLIRLTGAVMRIDDDGVNVSIGTSEFIQIISDTSSLNFVTQWEGNCLDGSPAATNKVYVAPFYLNYEAASTLYVAATSLISGGGTNAKLTFDLTYEEILI